MRKALFLSLIVAVLAFAGIAIAADKIGTMGSPNSSGTYAMEAFDDRSIVVASDATFTVEGTADAVSLEVGDPTIGGVLGTNYVAIENGLEVDGDLYADGKTKAVGDVFADGSIYMTTSSPAAAAGVGLWISQPDGGCSKCYVDAAGTTWACADATCPTGM